MLFKRKSCNIIVLWRLRRLCLLFFQVFFTQYGIFLRRKSVDKLVFLYLAKVFELVIFFPLFFYLLRSTYINPKAYVFVILSGIANTVYWFSLSKAYTYSDLSLVYPIARSAPAFIAIIAIAPWNRKANTYRINGNHFGELWRIYDYIRKRKILRQTSRDS